MIDINQPVEEGHDLVINEGGDQHLGDYVEFNEKAAEGLLTGVHEDLPVGEEAPVEAPKKKKGLVEPPAPEPVVVEPVVEPAPEVAPAPEEAPVVEPAPAE